MLSVSVGEDELEVRLAEARRLGQRHVALLDARDLRLARDQPLRGVEADEEERVAGRERAGAELGARDRRLAEQRGVVLHDREAVLGMERDDAARHAERAREGEAHVGERHRHGVAVDDDEAALGVDDEPAPAEAAAVRAVDLVRDVDLDEGERARERAHRARTGLVERDGGRRRARRGAAAGAASRHGQVPAASSRTQRRIGYQRRSTGSTDTRGLRGRSSANQRTGSRAPSGSAARRRSSASRSGTGVPPSPRSPTAPAGISARANA